MEQVRLVVIGAGISGLAAAWRAITPGVDGRALADPGDVLVLEGSPRAGGKLLTGTLSSGGAAVTLDLGAESMLARRPEGVALARAAGLAGDLVHPAVTKASVLAHGRLVPMPAGTVMGVPTDPANLRSILDDAELARASAEPGGDYPAVEDDVDVATWVAQHFGPAVADRLVEPLLGGVYAGHAGQLSLEATVPQLWALARAGGSLVGRLPGAAPPAGLGAGQAHSTSTTPVFAGIDHGVGRLPVALRAVLEARGAQIRTGTTVRAITKTATGWRLETGPAPAPEYIEAQRVIIAIPAPAAARLLAREIPSAATELSAIPLASMAVIATLVPRQQVEGIDGSGILVPPIEGHLIKAATFSSAKWAWVQRQSADHAVIRISIGRAGEEHDLQHPDQVLAERAVHDLGQVLERTIEPSDVRVQRWGGGLPQYTVGHIARTGRIRAAVREREGLAICGAAFDGVGIPACIAAAEAAVTALMHERQQVPGRMDA